MGCDFAEDDEKAAACREYLDEVQGAMRDLCKGMTAQSDAVSVATEHLNLTVQQTSSRHVGGRSGSVGLGVGLLLSHDLGIELFIHHS